MAVTPLINNAVKTNQEHKAVTQLTQQTNSKAMFNALDQKLFLNEKQLKVTPGGVNGISHWFIYYDIFFNHKTTKLINDNIEKGAGAIVTLLTTIMPEIAPFAVVVAGALVLQWSWWDVDGNDKGDGVQIRFMGPSSLIMIGCWPQQ